MTRNDGHINKGQILDRMRRVAANLFGVGHTELLDPVVNLFLESLSEEVYKMAGEIDNIENRILEKLSSILVPSIDTIAKPAHCILHVVPQTVGVVEITTEIAFKTSGRKQNRKYSFHPACNTRIYNGRISHFIHQGEIYTIDHTLSKIPLVRSNQRNKFDSNTFWLGLELDESVKDISGLSFYFDLYAVYDKGEYLNLLPYTIWSVGDETLVMHKGIFSSEKMYENNTLELFSKYDLLTKVNQSVINQYDNHFLTITNECLIPGKKEYLPSGLSSFFPENIDKRVEHPLIWIKITCPHRFTPDIINSLQPSINAFPILNKELISKITKVNMSVPVIPMKMECNQSFLSVHNVNDSAGIKYYDIPINDTGHTSGIYAVRRGGIERFSKRDAGEYLTNIIDILSNKVSSFFKDKKDIKSDLKKIESQINLLINDLKKKQAQLNEWNEVENYLLLSQQNENTIYFIDYWVTNGKEANHIRAWEGFTIQSELPVSPASVYSLTMTKGGSFAPLGEKKQNLYKKLLTQHNLLVTDKDILDFCLKEFKESICKVSVCKGFMESGNPGLGFVETTDVYLTPVKNMDNFINEKDEEYFYQVLKKNSPATFNYRIFIN